MSQVYGYIRVSTREQKEDRQLVALSAYQIPEKNLFLDKQSGKDFDRLAYKRLLRKLKPGDLVIVKSIDRLGRNYEEILEQWRIITKEKKADVKVLDMPLLDTRHKNDLTGTLIADIVLQILSYVAQSERENIRRRQAEGIAAARAKGKHLGRVAKPLPEEFYPVYERWSKGEYTYTTAAEALNITIGQFRTMMRKYQTMMMRRKVEEV